jgi:taurine dioxygenase
MARHPALMVVGNTEEEDRAESVRNGTALWRTDQPYEAIPASATMLYANKVPTIGGETQFCNMTAAYEDLDRSTKGKLESLQVAHQYGRGKLRSFEFSASPIRTGKQREKLPIFYHPLVMKHHITGEKTLYGIGQKSYGIKDMEDNEAVLLLEELKDHILSEEYIYRHKYQVGDIAV